MEMMLILSRIYRPLSNNGDSITTPAQGSSGQLDVDLQVITNFNSNWNVSFDAPGGIFSMRVAQSSIQFSLLNHLKIFLCPASIGDSRRREAIVDGSPEIVATEHCP